MHSFLESIFPDQWPNAHMHRLHDRHASGMRGSEDFIRMNRLSSVQQHSASLALTSSSFSSAPAPPVSDQGAAWKLKVTKAVKESIPIELKSAPMPTYLNHTLPSSKAGSRPKHADSILQNFSSGMTAVSIMPLSTGHRSGDGLLTLRELYVTILKALMQHSPKLCFARHIDWSACSSQTVLWFMSWTRNSMWCKFIDRGVRGNTWTVFWSNSAASVESCKASRIISTVDLSGHSSTSVTKHLSLKLGMTTARQKEVAPAIKTRKNTPAVLCFSDRLLSTRMIFIAITCQSTI